VKYVKDAVAEVGLSKSGGIYVNWGDDNCPADATLLYSGYGFSAPYDKDAGGSNPICIQGGDAGPGNISVTADKMLPLITGVDNTLPTNSIDSSSKITGDRIVKCALCFNTAGICYTHYGSHNCGSGFNNTTRGYRGYVLGSFTTTAGENFLNPTNRACVNSFDFDAGQQSIPAGSMGAMWYGSEIQSNFGLGYTTNTFIKCSVCCK
jgi:hypothetical protein